jgi:hypothetical protein
MMARKNSKHCLNRLDFILICCMSSSLLTTSYALPINVLASPLHSRQRIIAKTPDERQPEAVEKGIEQIPTVQAPVSQQRKQSIESPLPPITTPTATGTTPPPEPVATGSSSTPTATSTTPQPKPPTITPSTPTATRTTPQPKPATTGSSSTPTATGTTPQPKPATTTPSTPTATVTTPQPKPATTTPSTPTATVTTPQPKPATTTPSTPTATVTTPQPKPATTGSSSTSTATGTTLEPKPATITPSISTVIRTTPQPKPATTGSSSTSTATGTTLEPKPATITPSISTVIRTTPTAKPSDRLSTSPRQRGRQPGSPISTSITPTFREINFVDMAFGVLAPGDYQSQGRHFHFYQFEGRENQLIQIRLTGSADQRRSNNLSLNPFLFLLDSNNQVLLKRGTGGGVDSGRVKDAFVFVRLPAKGTYTIAVTSQNPREKGRYSLALRNDRASYSLDQSNQLTLKNSTLRQNGSPYNVSKFQGKKDQLVSIRADSVFEEFSPYVVLLNSKGQIVASDSDKDGKYSALIDRARLPADDTYYIVVISANAQERGTYRLTVF